MDYTLDNGLIVTRKEAKVMIVKRLGGFRFNLDTRQTAAALVTAPESGHAGYTVSALVREAYDLCLFGYVR